MSFNTGKAAAQDEKVHSSSQVIERFFNRLRQQIRTLVRDQPAYKGDQRVCRVEAIPAAQLRFILLLAFLHIVHRIMMFDISVRSRVPYYRVYTVQDPAA